MDEESTEIMAIPPGITSSWRRNPPEEYISARIYKLMDEECTHLQLFNFC
jgi:hypothetical protein